MAGHDLCSYETVFPKESYLTRRDVNNHNKTIIVMCGNVKR